MADFLSKLARDAGQKEPRRGRDAVARPQPKGEQGTAKANGAAAKEPAGKQPDPKPAAPVIDIRGAARALKGLGLFDETFYATSYPDVIAVGADPFEHFFLYGYKEGRKPNPIFDPIWYVTTYPDVQEAHPLLHYASVGEPDGRRPSPYFQPAWYREKYGIPES